MKPKNNFRAVVYVVIIIQRIKKMKDEGALYIKLNSLKTFTNYYEGIDGELKSWIFSSVRGPYLSIFNFDQLKIDMTDTSSFFTSESDVKDKYIKLEVNLLK